MVTEGVKLMFEVVKFGFAMNFFVDVM